MKALESTPSFDLYSAPIESSDRLLRRGRERAAALGLVRAVFGPCAGIGHSPEGAPYVEGAESAAISISHDSDTCILAVGRSGEAIGVDIERPRQQLMRIRSKFLSSAETARLESHSCQEGRTDFLLRCWTAKEAVYKCALTPGLGLTEIETSEAMDRASARGESYSLSFRGMPDGAVIAVAVKSKL